MDDLVQLLHITPAADVQKKWRISDDRFEEIVKIKRLPVYTIREKRIRPSDGKTIYFCQGPRFSLLREVDLLDYHSLDCERGPLALEGEYFCSDDIKEYEAKYPEVLWALEPEEGQNKDAYIPAEEVRKQLRMSPIQFVDMLNGQKNTRLITSWEEWYRYSDANWFETHKLGEVTIHPQDLEEYLRSSAQQLEAVPSDTPDGKVDFSAVLKPSYTELEELLAASQKQIEDNTALRQWNKYLNDQNQELRAELEKAVAAAHEEMRNIAEQAKTSIHNVASAGDGIEKELQTELAEKEFRIAELETQLVEAQTIIAKCKTNAPQPIDFSDGWSQDSPEYIVAVASIGDTEEAKDLIAEKDARIALLEAQLSEKQKTEAHLVVTSSLNTEQDRGEGAWEDSVTAVCKAVVHVLKEGRQDWVSGQERGTGNTDSAGKETFRALLERMHPKAERCRTKAESAAWKVLSCNGYTHSGGRKPNP